MKFYPFKMNSVYLSSKINIPDIELQHTVQTAIANSIVLKTSLTIRLFQLKIFVLVLTDNVGIRQASTILVYLGVLYT